MLCLNCKKKNVIVSMVYSNSSLKFCLDCLIEHLKLYGESTFKHHMPPCIIPTKYIIPNQYFNGKNNKNGSWFPVVLLKFGDNYFRYGKTLEEYERWYIQAMSNLEMNIP